VTEFVNADTIAPGLSGFSPEHAAFDAGRVMLARLCYLAAQRCTFAFETTLASRTFAPRLKEWIDSGYAFHLIYFWLPSADFALARVRERVQLGGRCPRGDGTPPLCTGISQFLYAVHATCNDVAFLRQLRSPLPTDRTRKGQRANKRYP
jgi:hypothetical protein